MDESALTYVAQGRDRWWAVVRAHGTEPLSGTCSLPKRPLSAPDDLEPWSKCETFLLPHSLQLIRGRRLHDFPIESGDTGATDGNFCVLCSALA